jgi:pyruvate/2-oxoglutarate dehydrogenase complex dihydrolipoamide dehydrogenase (E3) component
MDMDYIEYDAIVIGAGQGGPPLAMEMANAGWRVALVERGYVGGSCINTGCTPTKTMIASARVAHIVNRAGDYGVKVESGSVELSAVLQRKQEVVESFRHGSKERYLSTQGLTLVEGQASFSGEKELEVELPTGGKEYIKADKIIIDTGSSPFMPPIEGLSTSGAHDSTSIQEIERLPDHLLIIGGGYVGVEFAQMFRRFGSDVTIIQRGSQLLTAEDQDVAEEVAEILRQDGINVLLSSDTVNVDAPSDQKIVLTVKSGEKEKILEGSHLLVATGRTPNTPELNLESTGITVDEQGYIPVNNKLETEVPGIFAIGDVNGGPAFTHISYDDFRIIAKNLLEGGSADISGRQLPYVVFTDPQLGRIGMTEKGAREIGHKYRVAKMPMSWVARAIETDETRGLLKAVVDDRSGQILGAAVLGVEGGELMAALQVAMLGGLPYTVLRDATFAHPSLAESFNKLFGMLDG